MVLQWQLSQTDTRSGQRCQPSSLLRPWQRASLICGQESPTSAGDLYRTLPHNALLCHSQDGGGGGVEAGRLDT